jgi:hypothetical protein
MRRKVTDRADRVLGGAAGKLKASSPTVSHTGKAGHFSGGGGGGSGEGSKGSDKNKCKSPSGRPTAHIAASDSTDGLGSLMLSPAATANSGGNSSSNGNSSPAAAAARVNHMKMRLLAKDKDSALSPLVGGSMRPVVQRTSAVVDFILENYAGGWMARVRARFCDGCLAPEENASSSSSSSLGAGPAAAAGKLVAPAAATTSAHGEGGSASPQPRQLMQAEQRALGRLRADLHIEQDRILRVFVSYRRHLRKSGGDDIPRFFASQVGGRLH